MTKEEIIIKIQNETLSFVEADRKKQIEKYIELWEKYIKGGKWTE